VLNWVDGQRHVPAALSPEKTRYPLYRRLSGSQSRSERVRNISPHPGFDPWTVQPVAISSPFIPLYGRGKGVPFHAWKYIGGNRSTAPFNLNLGTKCSSTVSCTPPTALSLDKTALLYEWDPQPVWTVADEEKSYFLQTVERVASRYTDRAIADCSFTKLQQKTSNIVRKTKARWWTYWLYTVHAALHYGLRTRDPERYSGWYIYLPVYSKRIKSHT
jgi:hypothetical protein